MFDLTKAVVDASFDDAVWRAAVNELGADKAVAILRGVYGDIGLQVQQRASELANLRDSDTADDSEYFAAKDDYNAWLIRANTIRRSVHKRIKETGPEAQRVHQRHQADRRIVLRLAKRIWLWEQGLPSDLETALDDLDVSHGPSERRPLRQVVEALIEKADGKVLT
jgi:hypothetical protein